MSIQLIREAVMSRRTFITSATAASVPAGLLANKAVAASSAATGNDDALFEIVQEWKREMDHFSALCEQSDTAEEQYHTMRPEFPTVLTKTERDWELGLCAHPNHASEGIYGADLVEKLRRKPIVRGVQQPALKKGVRRTKTVLEPWPEAQARADEIVAAWDKYRADNHAALEQSGLKAVREALSACVASLHELEDHIARTRATTLQGLLLKARMVAEDPAFAGIEDQIKKALQARESTGQFIGLSLVRDILHMNRRDA